MELNNLSIIYICLFSICIVIISFYLYNKLDIKKTKIIYKLDIERIKHFEKYETLFSLYLDKAYKTIYKDHILVYSVDAVSPNEEDITKIQKLYMKLLLELMGENLISEFIGYYGNIEALFKNAIIYFDGEYENDAIKQSAIQKQMDNL